LQLEQEDILKESDTYNQKLDQIRNVCEKQEGILGSIEKSICKSRNDIKNFDQKKLVRVHK